VRTMNNKLLLTTVYDRKVLVHLVEDHIEHINVCENDTDFLIGTIVLGRVKKMIPSSSACFVDIGDDTQYFLTVPKDITQIHFADNRVHTDLHCEDVIAVCIKSEAVKSKAPSADCTLSICGRYVVVEPGQGVSVSQKIGKAARERLVLPDSVKELSKKYRYVIRTEAAELSEAGILESEIIELTEQMDFVLARIKTATEKTVLYKPDSKLLTLISNTLKYKPTEIITDDNDCYNDLVVSGIINGSEVGIKLYTDNNLSLAKLYKLESLIDSCLAKRVYMKSGGFLVVEQGETLTAIDVNSAHAISGNKEDASFKLNMEAAEEISLILKNRNISGMILIDFINMKNPKHVKELIEYVKKLLSNDDVRTTYVDMTGLGLVEITRQRKMASFSEQWKR